MTYQVTKWLMIVAGTWGLKLTNISETWNKIYKVYTIIVFVPYHSCTIMYFLKFCELVGVNNEKAVECLSMLIIVFLLIIKMAWCRTKEMTSVLQQAIGKVDKALTNENKYIKSVYSSYGQYANKLNVILTFWSFFVGLFLTVGAVFEDLDYVRTHDSMEDMPLQVLLWYPFSYQEHFKVVLGYQFYTILFSDLYNGCLQALPTTIMTQITAEIKILQENIRIFGRDNITGEKLSKENAYYNVIKLIKDHQNIISQISKLNKALRMNLLIEYGVSSVMLASILVQVISGNKVVFNSFYCGILAFGWFMLSYNANEIQLQSTSLGMAVYESNWYEQDKKTNQLLFILLMRTQKPLSVHIGPFGPMTIDAALSRFKLAYSYVSVMSS